MGFTGKQTLFIKYYVDTLNASKSALLAGYNKVESAQDNLQNPLIRAEIDKQLKIKHMTPEELKVKVKQIAEMDLSDYVIIDGETSRIDVAKLIKDGKGYLIKGIRPTRDGTYIEFDDRQKAIDTIAKFEAMFSEDKPAEININVNVEGLEGLLKKVYGDANNNND